MIKKILARLPLDRLRNLPPRERLLYFGGAAAAVFLLYLSIWFPMQRELARLRVAVPKQKVQLAQMQVQAMEINQLRASGRLPAAGGNLLATLEQSATVNGLRARISRMEPDGNNGARLSLDAINFNALITWIDNLQNQGGVHVEKATFETHATPGTVNARLILRGAGA